MDEKEKAASLWVWAMLLTQHGQKDCSQRTLVLMNKAVGKTQQQLVWETDWQLHQPSGSKACFLKDKFYHRQREHLCILDFPTRNCAVMKNGPKSMDERIVPKIEAVLPAVAGAGKPPVWIMWSQQVSHETRQACGRCFQTQGVGSFHQPQLFTNQFGIYWKQVKKKQDSDFMMLTMSAAAMERNQ